MYAALWRRLPGPIVVRLLILLVLVAVVVAVCFQWVFPAIAPLLPFDHNTVDNSAAMALSDRICGAVRCLR